LQAEGHRFEPDTLHGSRSTHNAPGPTVRSGRIFFPFPLRPSSSDSRVAALRLTNHVPPLYPCQATICVFALPLPRCHRLWKRGLDLSCRVPSHSPRPSRSCFPGMSSTQAARTARLFRRGCDPRCLRSKGAGACSCVPDSLCSKTWHASISILPSYIPALRLRQTDFRDPPALCSSSTLHRFGSVSTEMEPRQRHASAQCMIARRHCDSLNLV
jgi:hypothetical protein